MRQHMLDLRRLTTSHKYVAQQIYCSKTRQAFCLNRANEGYGLADANIPKAYQHDPTFSKVILFASRDGPRALACTDTAAHRSVQNSPLFVRNAIETTEH